MVLIDPVPGEEHRKISADYITCLCKVSVSSLMSVHFGNSVKEKNTVAVVNVYLLQVSQEERKLKGACESMLSLYPTQSYPLEVLCSHYLKAGRVDSLIQ